MIERAFGDTDALQDAVDPGSHEALLGQHLYTTTDQGLASVEILRACGFGGTTWAPGRCIDVGFHGNEY